jgi:hypothetical protein
MELIGIKTLRRPGDLVLTNLVPPPAFKVFEERPDPL